MKKSLIALAVLGGFSGMAAAQSSVTLFGVVDVNGHYVKNDGGGNRKSLATDGINSSRLGFRGVEDLGGGLRAGFWLEASLGPDAGTAGTGARFFHRRSTVSLLGGFGEVRLGRDYTPTFWNNTIFDPFGTNGVGSTTNIARFATGIGAPAQITFTRSDNTIGYFLPANIGGVYGQAMVAAGEGAAGKYYGGRVGFAGGPFNVAVALGRQDAVAGGAQKYKTANVGASWNIGFATFMAQFDQETLDLAAGGDQKERRWLVGAVVPLGQGEIHASFTRSDQTTAPTGNDADQIAVGYVYNLSKRTALYATGARINNKGTQAFVIPGGPALTPGGKSLGFEGGLRHSF